MTTNQWIAVLGGATQYDQSQIIAGYEVGRHIARNGRNLITGGTSGIPYAAAIGAHAEGGLVVGISPAVCGDEHVVRYKKPSDNVDLMIYTSMNVDGRSPLIIRSARAAIFIGGEFGTLNEFTSAWMHGKSIIGVLEGFGGVTDSLRSLLAGSQTQFGSTVVFGSEPASLVERICNMLDNELQGELVSDLGSDVRDMISAYVCREAV